MASCPHMSSCRMYSLFELSGTLKVWKINYCTTAYETCERYKRARASRPVPDNLLPNGKSLKK